MKRIWQFILALMAAGACSGRAAWLRRFAVPTGAGLMLALAGASTNIRAASIASWDFTGQNGPATASATASDPHLSGVPVLTRGSGAAASSGVNSFRTTGFKNDGITTANSDYFETTLSAATGSMLSLSTLDARFAGTASFYASPGVTSQFAYSLDGTTFTLIGSPVTSTTLTLAQVSLAGISALQNVPASTTIHIRYYASGQTTSGGWGFYSSASGVNGLDVGGALSTATPAITAGAVTGFGGQEVNTISAAKTYNLSGVALTPASGNLTVSPPAGFEVSLDGTAWVANPSALNVPYTGGALGATAIAVRFKPVAAGTCSGNIVNAGGGAAPVNTAVSGSGNDSSASDIIRDPTFATPANVAYGSYPAAAGLTTANSLAAARFILRDGGSGAHDADTAGTTLTAISFALSNSSNLRRVALFDGSGNNLGEAAAGPTVTFSGLTLTAPDDGAVIFSMRVTFQSAVTDNAQYQFAVTSATADAGGSTFADAAAGGAASDTNGNANRIVVTATRLMFNPAPPAAVILGANFSATAQAQDANGNLDLDAAGAVTITRAAGTGTLSGGAAQNLAGGTAAFASLNYDTAGDFTIQAAAAGLAPATSGTITATVVNAATVLFIAVPTGSAWRTAGNWAGNAIPTGAQVALFGLNPQSEGGVGINFAFTGNNQVVGALAVTNTRTLPLFIGNSSMVADGVLTLDGATVNGVGNVVLRNQSSQDVTLQAVQFYGGNMGVVLGDTIENKVMLDGPGNIVIGSNISGGGRALTVGGSGSGALILGGTNTYSGNTTISAGTLSLSGSGSISNSPNIIVDGTLDVSGATGGVYTLAGGQTLTGNGGIKGTVLVADGATVSPGAPIGTLVFSNAPMLSGKAAVVVDKSGGTTASGRLVLTSGTLAFGGALTVTKTGTDTLAAGDSFTLFAAGGFNGCFCTVNLPALASGLSWDTNKLATAGVLDVYSFATNAVETMSAPRNTTVNLLIAKLLSKAASSRGAVALSSVNASSAQGGAVAVNGDYLVYTPPAGFTGGDAISCVLQDGHGTIPATVVVTVSDPGGLTGNGSNLAIRPDGSGGVLILIAGTTNVTYQLQCSDTLSPANWQNFGPPFAMPVAGITNIDDPGGAGQRYYRTILP
jgi:autotransporter-associated beta strand protein